MSSHKPEDWPSQFTKHLNAGNLDAVTALPFASETQRQAAGEEPEASGEEVRRTHTPTRFVGRWKL